MSNLIVDTLDNQDVQLCKAWVNFNGTGVVAIRSDHNVSSITDNGVGDYTVNFTNNMTDANYSVALGGKDTDDAVATAQDIYSATYAVGGFRVHCKTSTGTLSDWVVINAVVFGN